MNEVLLKLYLNAAHCYLELAEIKKVLTYARKVRKFGEMLIRRILPVWSLSSSSSFSPLPLGELSGVGMLVKKFNLTPEGDRSGHGLSLM